MRIANFPILSDTDWCAELPDFSPVTANVSQASFSPYADSAIAVTQTPLVAPVALLAEWSVTTPAYIRYGSKPYQDTPRSRWEAAKVAAIKAVA